MRVLCLLAACTLSPLSLDVHYSADRQPLPQAEALGKMRIGVARFKDLRPMVAGDIHARSYVAHDGNYHVGMTWNGRTFAPVAEVTQGLLVAQLQGAGLNARAAGAEVDADDGGLARGAAQRGGFDVVLGGNIREFSFKGGLPTVSLEVGLFRAGGDSLMHAPLSESQSVDPDATPQVRVDQVLDRSFRPVARDLVAKIADQVGAVVAGVAEEKAREADAQAAARLAVAQPSPSPAPVPPEHRRGKRR